MGGRGANGRLILSGNNNFETLDTVKIERANGASALGNAGDRLQRTFERNISEIRSLELTNEQKKEAIKTQKELVTNTLEIIAKNPNPYGAGYGPARINTKKANQGADKIANAENSIETHMNSLRRISSLNKNAQETSNLAEALKKATSAGELTVTVNNKTYYRTRKNSSTWRVK